jgi:hypothetical protein
LIEPFWTGHPWLAALLLGTAATPAAVILAVPAPRPLDLVLAWPLVLLDVWVGPSRNDHGSLVQLLALAVGVVLTWMFYVLVARVALWRVGATKRHDDL